MSTTDPTRKHVYEVLIRTDAATLWRAITDPDVTARYWHATRAESTWQPGARWAMRMLDGSDALVGEIVESDPPRRLVTTFRMVYDPALAIDPPSRCTWEIEPFGDLCRLRLTHDGFASETETFGRVRSGWAEILSSLKSLLETGEPLDLTVVD